MSFKLIRKEREKEQSLSYTDKDNDMTPVPESTDIANTIKELNKDEFDSEGFSSIDMKAAIHPVELSAILCVDTLVVSGFLPKETAGFLTRKKLRLSVSENRKGREDIVQIAQGMNQNKTGASMWDKIGGVFRGGN